MSREKEEPKKEVATTGPMLLHEVGGVTVPYSYTLASDTYKNVGSDRQPDYSVVA